MMAILTHCSFDLHFYKIKKVEYLVYVLFDNLYVFLEYF